MPTDPEKLGGDYQELVPSLEQVCESLKSWLQDSVRQLGIADARIEGRVKKVHSMVNKALRRELQGRAWDDPLVDASDKVGLRVDVVYADQVDKLSDHIVGATDVFAETEKDDKREKLKDREFDYQGVHIDVIPAELPEGLAAEHARCEIQVRTNAQSAWAMALHDLTYKPPEGVELPAGLWRSTYRLTALLELFDEGVSDAKAQMMGAEGYPLAIVAAALEAQRSRFTFMHHDRLLTRQILADLGVVPDDPEAARNLADAVEAFVDENEAKLRGLYEQHLESAKPALLVQPEAILVFYLLDDDRFAVPGMWKDAEVPYKSLEALADIWGVPLPEPA